MPAETTLERIARLQTELIEARKTLAGEQQGNWIPTGTAAAILGVSRPTVIRMAELGVLGMRRVSAHRQVWAPDVYRRLEQGTTPAADDKSA